MAPLRTFFNVLCIVCVANVGVMIALCGGLTEFLEVRPNAS